MQHIRKTHIEFQVTHLKVKVIMTDYQTIKSSAMAMTVFSENTSYFIFKR